MKRGCQVDGCGYGHHARGFCVNHYRQARNAGNLPAGEPREVWRDDCEVCGRASLARGRWCWTHYRQQRVYRKATA